ncbi:beta-galactosidase [Termitidicoccus mucosus]
MTTSKHPLPFACMPSLRFFVIVLAAFALPAATAASDPLENSSAYSLLRNADGSPREGAYPMGFVRGRPEQVVQLGYNQAQDTAMFDSVVKGLPYPGPSAYLQSRLGLQHYSMALPADSLAGLFSAALRNGATQTGPVKGIGPLRLAIGPDGKPYAHPSERTRDLPKIIDLCDVFDPNTRLFLKQYVTEHVKSRAGSPIDNSVVRWGLDNEWEARPNHSPGAKKLFVEWLKRAYGGDIAALNEAWGGTTFKKFDARLAAHTPDVDEYAKNPGLFLDWCEFQAGFFTHVMAEQMAAMREADPRKRGVVHKSTQITLEVPDCARMRMMDHGSFAEAVRPYGGGLYGIDMYGAGDRQAYEANYIYNCIRPADRAPGFGVMLCENNNHGGPGHQFAATEWRLLANGVKGMMYFTPGYIGAPKKDDFNTFAFIDPVTGRPKDKLFYAARWAGAVHRSEKFWTDAVPAPGLPRIAMLVPKRDILLSERSDRNKNEGRFSYPRNHRWMVFRWLREQGYWVDVLPYEKLRDDYLAAYDALVLVGAEHLAPRECEAIARFTASGRVLVADTMPGYFDQHHRKLNAFAKPMGVEVTRLPAPGEIGFELDGRRVAAKTPVSITVSDAEVLAKDEKGAPLALLKTFHDGRILLLPFELGSLVHDRKADALASTQSVAAPTAGSEHYAAFPGEFDIGAWLGGLLARAGVKPATAVVSGGGDATRIIRIEQPYVDAAGNIAVVVADRAQLDPQEKIPAGEIELPLPDGAWESALWAAAEDAGLHPVKVRRVSGALHRVSLPEVASAGVLYFFRKHDPLIGLSRIETGAVSADGQTAKVAPGATFAVSATLFNTTGATLPEGGLRLLAPAGWTISGSNAATPALAPGASAEASFTITAEPDGRRMAPDWIYPLVARWNTAGEDRAIAATWVEGAPVPADIPLLLTDNARYPDDYPYKKKTGATYRYTDPSWAAADPISKAGRTKPGEALTGGFGSIGGERNSFNRGDYVKTFYARYPSRQVEVVFDLRDAHALRRLNIVAGPEPVQPREVRVLTSEDGGSFALQKTIAWTANEMELIAGLDDVRARHVKLVVEWPAAGGTLDEVEIWGR